MNFIAALKKSDLDYASMTLELTEGNKAKLQKYLYRYFRTTIGSGTVQGKKARELVAMFSATEKELTKNKILHEIYFSSHIYGINCSTLSAEMCRALLMLTFPMIREILLLVLEFGDNYFTPEILVKNLQGKYGSEETVRDSVYRALATLVDTGIVKKLKKGLFQRRIIAVYDTLGLYCTLLAVVELADENTKPEQYLRHLSFELTHEFIEYFNDIDYTKIVPTDVWEEFNSKYIDYSIHYQDGEWSVSNKPFFYKPWNITIEEISKYFYTNLEDIKFAKNEKKFEEYDRWQSPCK